MKSPLYPDVDMKEVVREVNGVTFKIDVCPVSHGVWLDAGELDKIIQVAKDEFGRAEQPRREEYRQPQQAPQHYDDDYHHPQHKKRRGGFIEELFDF